MFKNETLIEGYITNVIYLENVTKIYLKSKEKILVNDYNKNKYNLGDKIKIYGQLKEAENNTNFNLFNYKKYLLSQKINYTFTLNNYKIEAINKSISYKIKSNLIKKIENYKSKDYLNAFILGNSKYIDNEILNSYRNNGISHLLAVSGMHIAFISGFILFILNKIKKSKFNYIIVISLLLFYCFITCYSSSVLRATFLFVLVILTNKKMPTIYLLILLCSLFLLYNPFNIYNIGFLFSFVVTFFLILFGNITKNFKSYIVKTFFISLIAFLSSVPILINNFFSINFLSPFINVLFVPLVSFILYPLSWIVLIAPPLDNLLYLLISFMEYLSNIINEIKIFTLILKHINLYILILYYLLIILALYKMKQKNYKYLLLFFCILLVHHNINYLDKYPTITMIDVGQGDSHLIKLDHNKGNILIDTGGLVSFDNKINYTIVKNTVIPYLKSEGITKLKYLILTHGDFDHCGEAIELLKNFNVENVIINNNKLSINEKNIINYLKNTNIKNFKYSNNIIKIKEYKFAFLNNNNFNDENDNSLVIYTKMKERNIIFMGDASSKTEQYLLNEYNLPQMDILKVGHHGSNTSSSINFINKINPKISLISVGKNNLYGHPNDEIIERLKNSKIYLTSKKGAVKIILKNKIYVTSAR